MWGVVGVTLGYVGCSGSDIREEAVYPRKRNMHVILC